MRAKVEVVWVSANLSTAGFEFWDKRLWYQWRIFSVWNNSHWIIITDILFDDESTIEILGKCCWKWTYSHCGLMSMFSYSHVLNTLWLYTWCLISRKFNRPVYAVSTSSRARVQHTSNTQRRELTIFTFFFLALCVIDNYFHTINSIQFAFSSIWQYSSARCNICMREEIKMWSSAREMNWKCASWCSLLYVQARLIDIVESQRWNENVCIDNIRQCCPVIVIARLIIIVTANKTVISDNVL